MAVEDIKRALQDLLDKRARLWESEGKPLTDIAAQRAFTVEEEAKSADVEAAFLRFDRAIKQTRDQIEAEKIREAEGFGGGTPSRNTEVAERIRGALRNNAPGVDLDFNSSILARALGSATGSDGAGNTIQQSKLWSEFLIPLRDSVSVIDAGARVVVTGTGESMQIPYLKTFGAAESGTSESTTMAGTDPTFGLVQWDTTKKDQVSYAPRELIEDSTIDIEELVGSLIGLNIGYKVGAAASAAVATAVSAGATGAATKYVPQSFDEVIDLEHSIPRLYRRGAVFLANDTVTKALRKLKDSQGQYLWQPALTLDQPDMLNGKPYMADAFLEDPAAGKRPLLYGNFKLGVWMRIVGSLRLERSDQAAWAKDQIGFKGVLRTGQAVVDLNAVKAYQSGPAS